MPLLFFTTFTLGNAVWHAARAIRTGRLSNPRANYAAATTNEGRKKPFKKAMCARAPSFFDCLGKGVVIVQSNANFGNISEPKCATNDVMAEEASAAFSAGDASSVMLVTAPSSIWAI